MTYEVLSRRLRPQKFFELIGHDFMRLSLQAAILEQRLASAFIFSGLRGTGKTSLARILAKAINCTELHQKIADFAKLPPEKLSSAERKAMLAEVEPCDLCQACVEIKKGTCPDVIEIDAASNRGIENIRSLKEEVFLSANYCFYKVYIIDEAHMLTQESFNALLKILEEPPSHVKFILASTELKKIPSTILSRCLNYEFAAIEAVVLEQKLREIVALERPNFPPHWLPSIVKNSSGSVRDALSTLESLLHLDVEEGEERLASFLGFSNLPGIFDFLTSVLDQDPKTALAKLSELLSKGMSAKNFLKDLLEAIKLILVAGKLAPEDAYFQSNWQSFTDQIFQLKAKLSPTKAHLMFDLVLDFEVKASKTELEKSLLEVLTLRLSSLDDMIGVKELIRALKDSSSDDKTVLPPPSLRLGTPSPSTRPLAEPSRSIESDAPDFTSGLSNKGLCKGTSGSEGVPPLRPPPLEVTAAQPKAESISRAAPAPEKPPQPFEKAILGADRIKMARANAGTTQGTKNAAPLENQAAASLTIEEAPLYEEPEPAFELEFSAEPAPSSAGQSFSGSPASDGELPPLRPSPLKIPPPIKAKTGVSYQPASAKSVPLWALGQDEAGKEQPPQLKQDALKKAAELPAQAGDAPQKNLSENTLAKTDQDEPLGLKKQHQALLEKDKEQELLFESEPDVASEVAEDADAASETEPYSSAFNSLTAHAPDEALLGELLDINQDSAPMVKQADKNLSEKGGSSAIKHEPQLGETDQHAASGLLQPSATQALEPSTPKPQAKKLPTPNPPMPNPQSESSGGSLATKEAKTEESSTSKAFNASKPFPPFDHEHWLLFIETHLDPPADRELFPPAYLAMLHCSKLLTEKNGVGVLAVPQNFVAQGKELIPLALLTLVQKYWGQAYSFQFVEEQETTVLSYLEQKEQASQANRQKLFQTVSESPLIKQALDLFGGRLEIVEKKTARPPKK